MASTQANKRWRIDYKDLPVEYMKNVLKSANYTVPKNQSARSLSYMELSLAKIDIGIMQYSRMSKDDLRNLLKQRGMPVPNKRTSKAALSELLEADDYSPNFPRFMELPPEIRVMVYRHSMISVIDGYFRDPADAYLPLEPGTVHASRIVRAEALPVFYSTKTFPLYINATPKLDSDDGLYPQMDLSTYIFLRNTEDKYFVNFKHLKFYFHHEDYEADVAFTAVVCKTATPVLDLSVDYKESHPFSPYNNLRAMDAFQYEMRKCRRGLEKLIPDVGHLTGVKIIDWMKTFMASLIDLDKDKEERDGDEDDDALDEFFPVEISLDII